TTERKEKEKALRESEERFKQVAESAEEWIWEVDANGMYTYSSPLVEKILGYKPEEIVGKKRFYDLFHPENRENLMKAALKAFEQKQPFHDFINKNVQRNGEAVWLSTSGVPILDQQGKLVGYRGTDTNITEFKKAEEALRISEKTYRALINGMNDTAWVIDFNGNFIDVNDAAVKVLGYSREELLSGGIQEIDKHLTKSEVQALISRLPTVGTQVFETVHTTKDGKDIPVEISSSLVTYQGKKAILSIARDITERKKDKEKLVKDQEELNLIINSSPIIIFYKDKEGKFLRVNKAFAEALQTPQKEFVEKTVFDFYTAEIAQGMANDDMEVLKSGRPKLGIIEQYESASGLRWVQTDKIPIFDENGVPNGIIGFALDITERVEMQKNWKNTRSALKKLLKKGQTS
ncbi:PAS domain-containing protein, partial [Candidatus Bathyarchaeota archaeon]|nr:PAS domain-containing protein [Candidatus Bathyarchaeota archaeon]